MNLYHILESESTAMADRGSVTAKICRYICENIQMGVWVVGQKIPGENQLCAKLNVSRVSVRNALQQFIALGILESIRGKGTYLISDDLSMFLPVPGSETKSLEQVQTMKYILEFRCHIEPDICGQVAKNASPELIARLSALLNTMQTSVGKSLDFVQADVEFHMEICRACNNPITISIMNEIFQRRADLGHMVNLATGYYGGVYYHSIILDAIKKHDEKHARALMLEHLQRGILDIDSIPENNDMDIREEEAPTS